MVIYSFLLDVRILKPQIDCAMTKQEEGGCLIEYETMAEVMMQKQSQTMTFEENKKFMKDECPTVTDGTYVYLGDL